MYNTVSKEILDQLREIIDDVDTAKDVSRKLGISRTHAYRALKELGVDKLERNIERTKNIVLPLYRDGLSVREISEEAGFSVATVRRVIRRSGIEIDDRGLKAPYRPVIYQTEIIDPLWAAEFRGLFYADGCVVISETSHNTLRPYMVIRLRSDNKPLLDNVHSKLGGGMSYATRENDVHKNTNPQWAWFATGWSPCRTIIETTDLYNSLLSAKKAREVAIVYEAILTRWKMLHILGEENKNILRKYKDSLQEAKVFQFLRFSG
jgi:hypothetical protein